MMMIDYPNSNSDIKEHSSRRSHLHHTNRTSTSTSSSSSCIRDGSCTSACTCNAANRYKYLYCKGHRRRMIIHAHASTLFKILLVFVSAVTTESMAFFQLSTTKTTLIRRRSSNGNSNSSNSNSNSYCRTLEALRQGGSYSSSFRSTSTTSTILRATSSSPPSSSSSNNNGAGANNKNYTSHYSHHGHHNHGHHHHHHQHHHHHHKKQKNKKGILSPTARESAVIVEWEPVSELERRIEDGIHYEHQSYDPLLEYGSEDKRRVRKEWKEKQHHHQQQNESKGEGEGENEDQDDDNDPMKGGWSQYYKKNEHNHNHIENVNGVFCGFTMTEEERERLRSADPNE